MYNIAICDDDKLLCSQLEKFIYQYAKAHLIKLECYVWFTGETLCEYLTSNGNIDLIFLDIELTYINGIEVGTYIRNVLQNMYTSIVFISSKSKYAMELFKIQPLDFLIKPLTLESVSATLDIWNKIKRTKTNLFEYKIQGTFCYVPYNEIIYFNSNNKKINIILLNKTIEYTGKLKHLYKTLPSNFIIIHQSYIINMDYICECSYVNVNLVNGLCLNISQTYRKDVRKKLKEAKKEF